MLDKTACFVNPYTLWFIDLGHAFWVHHWRICHTCKE